MSPNEDGLVPQPADPPVADTVDAVADPIEGDDVADDGPTVDEAKAAALQLVHEGDPAAVDLPTDVKNGDISVVADVT